MVKVNAVVPLFPSAKVTSSILNDGNTIGIEAQACWLSTVAHVDRVVVLEEGRLVDSGTHDELLRSSAFYRQLVQTQLVEQA